MIFLFFIHFSNTYSRILNKSRKRILINISFTLILILSSIGCEKIPDGIVEQTKLYYNVKAVSAPVNFSYSASDSNLTTSIEFDDSKFINKVWLQIKSADGTTTITPSAQMLDNGNNASNGDLKANDNIFSTKVGISKKVSNGKYFIEYFVEDKVKTAPENLAKAASHSFTYNNNQISYPPVISNLTIPNSVARGESFIFTIKVEDGNGLGDISQVYFKLFRPDGSQVDPQNGLGYFLMADDGNFDIFGDRTAGDGTYSFKNFFAAATQTGQWKFEFQAKDKSGNLSNTIIHLMTVN
ncbi:MAG: hypothetical protein AB1432_00945 [Bacteroidota bacterium]